MTRGLLVLIYFTLFISVWSEIVSIPGYNYSIYPLEGRNIQEYSNDAELSWLSENGNIALSVSAWSGDRFTNVQDMFSTLTSSLNATGKCVRFTYLGRDSVIGEITITIDQILHKGWIVLIDGQDFDYFLISFSLEVDYIDNYQEIQSVLDSFSITGEGEYKPGPITTFLDGSPNKDYKTYEVHFFDQTFPVSVSDSDFSSAQTVIEREANIMKNYSNDPNKFYKAWRRYYQVIFRDSYSRMEPIYRGLYPYLKDGKYSSYDVTELLMFWIQSFKYERELNTASDLLNPFEGAVKGIGDCDSRSLVLGVLLHKFKIKSVLLTSEKVKHALLAVKISGEGSSYEFDGEKFLYVELTAKALIGEIKESIDNSKLWTAIKMEYPSGE